MKKVFIGVGHGGADSGAVANGLREADVNLVMAHAMYDELRRHGVDVRLSRTKDEDDRLTEEIRECNAFGPDVAVEVHNNSGGGDGFEAFVYPGSSRARQLAGYIEDEVRLIGQNSRGVKESKSLGWVREVKAPAVLCEGFFLDSADAEPWRGVAAQRRFGEAYARGVLRMLGIAYKPKQAAPTQDNAPDGYAEVSVRRALEKDVLRGDGEGNLKLHEGVTRQDLMVILDRCGVL